MRRIVMAAALMTAALAAIVSGPAFSQSPVHARHTGEHHAHQSRHGTYPADAYGAATSFSSHNREFGFDRDHALRDCSAVEQKTSPTIRDSNLSMFEFRACMNEHGQPE